MSLLYKANLTYSEKYTEERNTKVQWIIIIIRL
jgi:hypothetical protein